MSDSIRWNDSLAGDFLWSGVNFGEAISEVMTPLSWSVLALTLDEWTIVPGYPPAGNIGGRPYLNISTYASIFHALRRSEQDLLEALEGTAYLRLPAGMEVPLVPLSKWSLLPILRNAIRFETRQRRAVRDLPGYLGANQAWCRAMRGQIQQAGNNRDLVSLWRDEIEAHVRQSVWAVLGSASHSSDHTTSLCRELTELVGRDDANALTSNLSDSSGLLASLGPLVGLAKVARGTMERDEYLAQYGHRGPEEFELATPRPAEDPGWLDQQLTLFHEAPADPETMLVGQRTRFEAAWSRFQARHPKEANAMRRRIDQVAPRARLREDARSEYARDRWVVRDFALRAGALTGLGEGIFFLSVTEMLDLLSGDQHALVSIPGRMDTYERYRTLPAYPPIIRGRFDPFQWAADPNRRSDLFDAQAPFSAKAPDPNRAHLIVGSPGSAGQVEGVVRRLERLESGDQLRQGEILVTPQTNIGWTFLFPRAVAIVTDVGAPLSHAAIVARELGIPAVVGCGDATLRLQTGDRVRVDGGRGVVEILQTGR
jgi:phosphohistidine swiveling domain-containing protein